MENASWASREIPCRRASLSLLAPREIVHCAGILGFTIRQPSVVECSLSSSRGKPFSLLSSTHGARDIDSTPPTSTIDASPISISRLACIAASSDEPHRRLTVAAGTDVGRPASSAAIRPTFRLSSPAWLASPQMMSSTRSRSRSGERSSSALSAWAARSSGRTPASAPP
jgi:hypothetical protein